MWSCVLWIGAQIEWMGPNYFTKQQHRICGSELFACGGFVGGVFVVDKYVHV